MGTGGGEFLEQYGAAAVVQSGEFSSSKEGQDCAQPAQPMCGAQPATTPNANVVLSMPALLRRYRVEPRLV